MMPATLSIVTHAFPPAERGKAIGTWAGISALALAIGPVLGGFLTEHVSWRAIFYLNVPVAIGAVIATMFAVRESRDETVGREVDYLGVATLSASLTALVLALIEGNSWGWSSPEIIALLAGSAVLMAGFVAVERRVEAPMVEFPLFASRDFVGTNLIALIVTFAMIGQFFFIAIYMQEILGLSALEAGVRFLPATLMIVAVAPARRPAHRQDRRAPADRRGPDAGLGRAVLADDDRRRHHLLGHLALLHPDGPRDGAGDVADVHRRDERGRHRQGRDRLRDPLDEPDGRRDARRRRPRRDLPVADGLRCALAAARAAGAAGRAAFVDAFSSAMWVATIVVWAGVVVALVAGQLAPARCRRRHPARRRRRPDGRARGAALSA